MELQNAITTMETNYAKIRICSYHNRSNCTLQLEPGTVLHRKDLEFQFQFIFNFHSEVESILSSSEDPDELKYYWEQWYNLAGTPTKSDFATYVRLKNEAARLNSKICWDDEFNIRILFYG